MLDFKNKRDDTDYKIINNIRALAIDMITNAQSGHPGICLGAAPILYTLYANHLNLSLEEKNWINRDRFILSAGHGSALLYAILYFLGYLTLDDLKAFRQIDSLTPGHPEIKTPGVDMATGPLGQGIASAVGFGIAERYLNSYFKNLINHYTYVLVGDGDLEEGISYEAMNLAGKLGLNKLIVLYDSNDITLDGTLESSSIENKRLRAESSGWDYELVTDGEDINLINNAILKAKSNLRPTLIEVKTIIGRYSDNQGSSIVHGKALTKEEVTSLKERLDVLDVPFNISSEALTSFREKVKTRLENNYEDWLQQLPNLTDEEKKLWDKFTSFKIPHLQDVSEDLIVDEESTRDSTHKIINLLATYYPFMMVGSADTRSSTKVFIDKEDYFGKDNVNKRNICYGVRENLMGAIANGLALSNLVPLSSTFLAFSDYLKPSLRLSALMNLFTIYIFSHDSISIGEDGPTHQPVEQLVGLRSVPNFDVYRPADLNEVIGSFKSVLKRKRPCAIITSRNKVNVSSFTKIDETLKGAYILREAINKEVGIIIATGEEVHLALDVYEKLSSKGYGFRLISMPSVELFEEQDKSYKEELLNHFNVYIIEASSSYSWYKYSPNIKNHFTVNTFGTSGKKKDILKKYNYDVELIVEKIESSLSEGENL